MTLSISTFFETTIPDLYDARKDDLPQPIPDGFTVGFRADGIEGGSWYLTFEDDELEVAHAAPDVVHLTVEFHIDEWETLRPKIESWLAKPEMGDLEAPKQPPPFGLAQLQQMRDNPGIISIVLKNMQGTGSRSQFRLIIGAATGDGLTSFEVEIDKGALDQLKAGQINLPQAMAMGLFQLRGDLGYAMKLGGLAMGGGFSF